MEQVKQENVKTTISNKRKKEQLDRSHILVVSDVPETYKCNICKKTFRNKKDKCYHDSCVTGVKPYKCDVCERTFVKRSHFEYHERVHTGYKPFQCSLCNKAFPQKNKLNRHMVSHKQDKEFWCGRCDKRYRKRDDLRNHMAVHTGDVTPHVCKSCGKSFRILANLNRHMHTHSNERPHVCEFCSKSFKDKSLLIRHKRIHGKERPFSCENCSRLFLSKSELVRHIAVHTDIKPFECTYCHTVFRRKDNLNRHIRHHHADNASSNETDKLQNQNNEQVEDKTDDSTEADALCGSASSKPTARIQKSNTVKKSAKRSTIPPTNISLKHPFPRGNSRDQINSRMDSLGNITPIIRGPGELSNAVPVINGPISASTSIGSDNQSAVPRKKTFTYTEPIPLAEAVVINRRIEEKLYPQNSSLGNNYYFFRKLPSIKNTTVPYVPMSGSINRNHVCNRQIPNTSSNERRDVVQHSMISISNKSESRGDAYNGKGNNGGENGCEENDCVKIRGEGNEILTSVKSDAVESANCVSTIQINERRRWVPDETGNTHHWRRRTAESLKSSQSNAG